MMKLRSIAVFLLLLCSATLLHSQGTATLPARIQAIMSRPEFAHSTFGIEFYSLDTGKVLYQINPDKLMVPGSTTKLLTEGTLLESLGGDYRFHTRVYRTGTIKKDGTLDGDIVLVATWRRIPCVPWLWVERTGCTSAVHMRGLKLRRFSRSWKAAVGCKSRCAITFPRFSLGSMISRSGAFQTLLPLCGSPGIEPSDGIRFLKASSGSDRAMRCGQFVTLLPVCRLHA